MSFFFPFFKFVKDQTKSKDTHSTPEPGDKWCLSLCEISVSFMAEREREKT